MNSARMGQAGFKLELTLASLAGNRAFFPSSFVKICQVYYKILFIRGFLSRSILTWGQSPKIPKFRKQ